MRLGLGHSPARRRSVCLLALEIAFDNFDNVFHFCRVAGGYNHPSAARAWAQFTSVALGRPALPSDHPLPIEELSDAFLESYAPTYDLGVLAGKCYRHAPPRCLPPVSSLSLGTCSYSRYSFHQETCKIATPRRTWPTSNGSLVCWPRGSVFRRKEVEEKDGTSTKSVLSPFRLASPSTVSILH